MLEAVFFLRGNYGVAVICQGIQPQLIQPSSRCLGVRYAGVGQGMVPVENHNSHIDAFLCPLDFLFPMGIQVIQGLPVDNLVIIPPLGEVHGKHMIGSLLDGASHFSALGMIPLGQNLDFPGLRVLGAKLGTGFLRPGEIENAVILHQRGCLSQPGGAAALLMGAVRHLTQYLSFPCGVIVEHQHLAAKVIAVKT